jgi:hypothetical protein
MTYMRVMRGVICEEACEACIQCEGFGNKNNERDNTQCSHSPRLDGAPMSDIVFPGFPGT